jgi:hypothetical protein
MALLIDIPSRMRNEHASKTRATESKKGKAPLTTIIISGGVAINIRRER